MRAALKSGRWPTLLVAVFILSRVVYARLGVRFDAQTLEYAEQFLDPDLLRNRLGESLVYLHCQPPLFNFYLGLVLKAFPGREVVAYAFLHRLLGLGMGWAVFALLRRFGVSSLLSALLVSWFLVSPACVLYENYLFDTYLITGLLAFSALFFHRFASSGRRADAVVLYLLLAAVVFTRNVFHLAWYLLVVLWLFLRFPARRKRVLATAALPTALVLVLYAKNLVLFGSPAASSSMGTTLYHVVAGYMPAAIRQQLVRESGGAISELSLLPPIPTMKPFKDYPPAWTSWPPTGVPALDREFKSDGKDVNFNHIAYLHINKRYTTDSVRLLLSRPEFYLRSVAFAVRGYFQPAADYFSEGGNWPIPSAVRLYDVLFYGRFSPPRLYLKPEEFRTRWADDRVAWGLVAAWLLLFFFGAVEAARRLRRSRPPAAPDPGAATLLFMLYTSAWWTAVTCLLSMGENMRHRFVLEPYFLVFAGVLAARLGKRFLPRPRRPASEQR